MGLRYFAVHHLPQLAAHACTAAPVLNQDIALILVSIITVDCIR
jgi:hypothetical protein